MYHSKYKIRYAFLFCYFYAFTLCQLIYVTASAQQRNPPKMENKEKYLLCFFSLFCFFCSAHGLCRQYFKENNYFTNADDSKPTLDVIFQKFVSIDYIHNFILRARNNNR